MNQSLKPKSIQAALAAAFIMTVLFPACGGKGAATAKAPAPAKVENAVPESALATLTLTSKAVERLGIVSAKAELRTVPRVLRLGGEIIVRPGGAAKVSAPSNGVLLAPDGAALPPAGARVAKGQTIARLILLPPNQDLIGARNDLEVKKKLAEVAAAKAARTEQLLKDKAVSEKANQEAQAESAGAQASFKAAQARWSLLNGNPAETSTSDLSTMKLTSPLDGILQKIDVAAGQTVTAGTPLFEVAGQSPVWVRVPVYAGDIDRIDSSRPALVELLGSAAGTAGHEARSVPGPSLGDAASASADLFYELDNADRAFRLGLKVGITISLRDTENGLVVPWSAILFDMQGGSWVYSRTAPNVFVRRRVEIRHIVGGLAILGRGLTAGEEVVTVGAAELFGTEFGAGK